MILAIDCETTGLDLYHGASPFLTTVCTDELVNTWWVWPVDPLTRKVTHNIKDLGKITKLIDAAEVVVGQNIKFDVQALTPLLSRIHSNGEPWKWPWEKTHDTLISGHLLASNHAKDLTSQALEYLSVDIEPFEDRMHDAVQACRTMVRNKGSKIHNWRIAKEGLPEMPSATDKVWKYDTWMPAQVHALGLGKPEWATVTEDYANTDSSVTVALYQEHQRLLAERDLLPIYEVRRRLVPIVAHMETYGVHLSLERLNELYEVYKVDCEAFERECLRIAAKYKYELKLPKGGSVNNSLREFIYDKLKVYKIQGVKTKSPSLDKNSVAEYMDTLPQDGDAHKFIKALAAKRKRATAMSYMESYQRFWIPSQLAPSDNWKVIHPSLNLTGTDTLRCSSSNPNEQNVSKLNIDERVKSLRYLFGPPPGYEWWSMDAANIELRIPAYESGEPDLIALFEKPNEPPFYGSVHALNFSVVFPDIWKKVLKEVGPTKVAAACKSRYKDANYQWVKNGGFAIQYGAVERDAGEGTADRAFHKPGAHALLKSRFVRQEQLNCYHVDYARKNGYIETMVDKSIEASRGYPLLCTRNQWGKVKETVPLNYHVQGTAMWWMCKAMLRCFHQLQQWSREAVTCKPYRANPASYRIVMQVHDELVFEMPVGRGKEPWTKNLGRAKILARLMAKGGEDIGVPTPVSVEYHPVSWADGISIKI